MSRLLISQYLNDLARLRQVSDLLARVTRVSVATQAIVTAMRAAPRN